MGDRHFNKLNLKQSSGIYFEDFCVIIGRVELLSLLFFYHFSLLTEHQTD